MTRLTTIEKLGTFIGCVMLVLSLVAALNYYSAEGILARNRAASLEEASKPQPKLKDRAFEAQYGCENKVRTRLKSPSSAEFPRDCVQQKVTNVDGNTRRYLTVACYDSQNAFGAMLRGKYACLVEQKRGRPDLSIIEFAVE